MGDKVFGGTGTLGHLFMYDTSLGQSTDLGEAILGYSTVESLIVTPDGLVYGTANGYTVDAHLFRVNPEDPSIVKDYGALIAGVTELGALALRNDGFLYGGAGDTGLVFRYGLVNGDLTTWDLGSLGLTSIDSLAAGAPGSKLYGGASSGYGNARLFSLNIVTGQAADLGSPVPGDTEINALLAAPDGRIYGGTSWAYGYLFSYDPTLEAFQIYGAPEWHDTEILDMILTGDGQIYGGTGWRRGRLFHFDPLHHAKISPGTAWSLAVSPKLRYQTYVTGVPEVWALAVAADGSVYASGYGLIGLARLGRWDPTTGTMYDLGWPPASPQVVFALLAGPDGLIYGGGGSYSGVPNLFSYDPGTGEFEYLPPDIPNSDYIRALAKCPNGLIFGGTGGSWGDNAQLFSYDPGTRAFDYFGVVVPGETAIESLVCTPGGRLYGGTGPNGHLFRLEPETRAVHDLGQPVPGETDIWALAWGADGRVYGGTGEHGTLFAFDPAGVTVVIGQPYAQDAAINGLVAAADGLIYGVTGSVEGHLFSYDPAAETLLDRGKATQSDKNAYSVAASADAGQIYVGTGYNYGDFFIYDNRYRFAWLGLDYETQVMGDTDVVVDVLDLAGNVLLADVSPGASLAGLPPAPAVQLRATLTTADPKNGPTLEAWSITWTQDPKLALAPGELSFVAVAGEPAPAPQAVAVTNDSGGTLAWSVAGIPDWLAVEPGTGEAPSVVTVTANAEGLPAGVHEATLVFSGPPECINCPLELPVSLAVIDSPLLELTPPALEFSAVVGETDIQTAWLTIANAGAQVLTWTVTVDAPWLAAVPDQGSAPPAADVAVGADPTGLAVGTYTATLTVSGPPNCSNCPQTVPVRLDVTPPLSREYLPMVVKGDGRY